VASDHDAPCVPSCGGSQSQRIVEELHISHLACGYLRKQQVELEDVAEE